MKAVGAVRNHNRVIRLIFLLAQRFQDTILSLATTISENYLAIGGEAFD